MFRIVVTDKKFIYGCLKIKGHMASMENKRDMEAVVKSRKEKEQRAVPQPVNKGQLSYKR